MLKKWFCTGWLLGHVSLATFSIQRPLVSGGIALTVLMICLCFLMAKYWMDWHAHAKFEKRVYSALFVALLSFILGQWHFHRDVEASEAQRVQQEHEIDAWLWVDRMDEQTAQRRRQSVLMYELHADPHSHQSSRAGQIQDIQSSNSSPPRQITPQRVVTYLPMAQPLQLGQWYRVRGRLEPIRGYAVPHVFDMERWAMQQGWVGRLTIHHLQALTPAEVQQLPFNSPKSLWMSFKLNIEARRFALRQYLDAQSSHWPYAGLMLALITGDESLLSKDIQSQFQRLGISHLLAISGPHVLLIALMLTYIWQKAIARYAPQVYLYLPKPQLSAMIFMLGVSLYTLFCGAEIPALRTWTFSLIAAIYVFLGQALNRVEITLLAASVMLCFQPLWVETAGFWLSFGASFILLHLYLTMKQGMRITHSSRVATLKLAVKVLIESQWKMFIALFPFVILFFKHVSWLAPITNLFSIPILGSVIVPLNLFATCVWFIFPALADAIFALSHVVIHVFIAVLNLFDQISSYAYQWIALTPLSLAGMGLAFIILFLPPGILPRYWAAFCFYPVLLQGQQQPDFALDIVDVGQGQAIFVQSKGKTMLIDTGGTWQGSQMDLTEWIWLPYFSRQGIATLDYVVLTHLDTDHSGAYEGLAKKLTVRRLITNEMTAYETPVTLCQHGQHYVVGAVKIKVLSPQQSHQSLTEQQRNEHSCVLLLELSSPHKNYRMLLMGDAGWHTEYQLLTADVAPIDVLVLGHHGSKHSSAYDFLSAMQPKVAIASAGYQNRYGHPHEVVKKRLEALAIPLWTTIEHGTIQLRLDDLGNLKLKATRIDDEKLLYSSE